MFTRSAFNVTMAEVRAFDPGVLGDLDLPQHLHDAVGVYQLVFPCPAAPQDPGPLKTAHFMLNSAQIESYQVGILEAARASLVPRSL
jgi:hypothetical protein